MERSASANESRIKISIVHSVEPCLWREICRPRYRRQFDPDFRSGTYGRQAGPDTCSCGSAESPRSSDIAEGAQPSGITEKIEKKVATYRKPHGRFTVRRTI